jgi:hypothetical protein
MLQCQSPLMCSILIPFWVFCRQMGLCLAGAMHVVVYDDECRLPPCVSRDVGEGAAAAPRPGRLVVALVAATLAQAGRDLQRITPRKPYRLRYETHSMIGKAGGTTKRAHGVRVVQRACWPRRTMQERRLWSAQAALRPGSGFRRHTDCHFALSVWSRAREYEKRVCWGCEWE